MGAGVGYTLEYTADGKISKRTTARGAAITYVFDPATSSLSDLERAENFTALQLVSAHIGKSLQPAVG